MRKTPWALLFIPSFLFVVAWSSGAHAAGPTYSQQGSFAGPSDSFFGYSVAIDANTALVGAWNDNAMAGAVYVYVRSGTTWSLQQTLTAADGAAGDEFGYAVALSGNEALVGAAVKDNGQGYVYAFARSGTTWALQQEFTETTGAPNDCFGCSLALSASTAVIGADGASGNVGAAFVYTLAGAVWSQQVEFLGQSQGDFFGFSVALDPAADAALVGAFGVANETGAAYLFTRSGTTWTQPQPPLTASDGRSGDRFGYAVAAGSGAALVGAYAAGGPGAAYAFAQSGATWSQQQKLAPPDPTGGDFFGASLALSGSTAVIGAYEHNSQTGAAYVFTSTGAGWAPSPAELSPSSSGQSFGFSVAASGTSVAIGAFGASNDAGAASFFAPAAVAAAPALGNGVGAPALMLLLMAAGALASRWRGVRPS
jgi:hypothetical protein